MADFVTLTCPNCGGKLQITKDIDRFACGHCGNEHIVKRAGGVISLQPVVIGLQKVQMAVDKTASELAINRLKAEIHDVERELGSKIDWFMHIQGYPPKPQNVSYRGVLTTMEEELNTLKSGLLHFIAGRRIAELQAVITDVHRLIDVLEDKRAELKRHEGIVSR